MKRIVYLTAAILLGIISILLMLSMFNGVAIAAPILPTAEIHVCPSGCAYSTIQAAVDAANNRDVIKVAAGIYTDTHAHSSPPGYAGPSNINQIVYIDKTVELRGGYSTSDWVTSDSEANPTLLDAQNHGRVIFISGNIQPIVTGFNILHGDATGLGGASDYSEYSAGGGVYVVTATATIRDNQIYNNTAQVGVGLYLYGAKVQLIGNIIFGNNSADDSIPFAPNGGAVYIESGNNVLSGNTIQNNSSIYGSGGVASFISNSTLTGNTIISNTGYDGGGIYLRSGTDKLINNSIEHNMAYLGGGIYLDEGNGVLIKNNTIVDNHATSGGSGGGIDIWGGTAELNGNTIISNSASTNGGGIFIGEGGQFILAGNQIVGNSAYAGGGVNLLNTEAMVMSNQIISNNSAGDGGGLRMYNTAATVGGNLIQGNTTTSSGNGGGISWYASVIDINPTTIYNNLVFGNSAGSSGGGISIKDTPIGLVSLSGNIVEKNVAGTDGGGVYAESLNGNVSNNVVLDNQTGRAGSGILLITNYNHSFSHNTISHNIGGDGSGVSIISRPYESSVILTNNIIVSQTVGISVSVDSQVMANGVLWFGNLANTSGSGAITITHVTTGNPEFFSDGYHLQAISAAINAGVPSSIASDIDNEPRPYQGYDLGADEYWPADFLAYDCALR
jgi:parallel beta-helix repeat protein